MEYSNFLLEERPLQKAIALEIKHKAIATLWKLHPLNKDYFILPEFSEEDEKYKKYYPTRTWYLKAERVQSEIKSADKNSNLHIRKEAFQKLKKSVTSLLDETRNQNRKWNADYLEAIKRNISECDTLIEKLNGELKNKEQTCRNFFFDGVPLKEGSITFLGRNDYKDRILFEINSSMETPTLFLRGQRRIGKTSLLNYLGELLGGGFYIIISDMQGLAGSTLSKKINSFVDEWKENIDVNYLSINEFTYSEEPLQAWENVSEFFKELAKNYERKVILCFDEYETFHEDLQKDEELGNQLIDKIRNFMQHQNEVVLLFTGLIDFSDRKKPDMNELTQVKTMKLDYLEKQFVEKLILNPYPEYTIQFDYPERVADEVFYQTQGHPLFVQQVGNKIVSLANFENRKDFTLDDVKKVIQEIAEEKDNRPLQLFWTDFCGKFFDLKDTVFEILDGSPPSDPKKIFRLEDYGFIIKEENKYKIRVPIFETWLRKYARFY